MRNEPNGRQEPRPVRTVKPGNRVLRVRTRHARLPLIARGVSAPVREGIQMLVDISTQTPILWFMGALTLLVILGPIPVWLFERTADNPDMTSYWLGLWWAVSAFSTAGHSDLTVTTVGGQIVGSIYTVLSVGLFFGSVLAAFSSYFILTWRKPKRQLVDTINYYLQRVDELSVEEIEDLEDMTRGLLMTSKEHAVVEERAASHTVDQTS